jgi:uncharacterized protein (TIGR00369 family)
LPPLTPAREATIRAALGSVPFVNWLGVRLDALGPGTAAMSLDITEWLKQNLGVVHGGATASLIDTAAAFAVLTVLQAGEKTTTTDLSIQYLRPLTEGHFVARAQVRRAGRRVVAVAVDVLDAKGALAATAITTYLRF